MYFKIEQCQLCNLCTHAKQVVTLDYCITVSLNLVQDAQAGIKNPMVLFVGEAPGADEDQQGKPFVGKAGKLLRETIKEAGFETHAITNVVKCRPPNNRKPTQEEIAICNGYLWNEINALDPSMIVALGATACEFLQRFAVSDDVRIMSYKDLRRRRTFEIRDAYTQVEFLVFATYHPSYILRGGLSKSHYLTILRLAKNMIPG
jgi:DNA polymerase